MSSSSIPDSRQDQRHPRLNRAWMALLVIVLIVVAITPIPWW